MEPMIYSEYQLLFNANNITPGFILANAPVGLFSNNIVVDERTRLVDLVEATFTGYARGNLATDVVAESVLGIAWFIGYPVFFQCSAPPSELLYGMFILDNFGALAYSVNFPFPIALTGVNQGICLNVSVDGLSAAFFNDLLEVFP